MKTRGALNTSQLGLEGNFWSFGGIQEDGELGQNF